MIKIAIDAMGGDFAPEQQVKGAIEALGKSGDFSVILAGDEAALKAELSKYKYDSSRVEIVHAPEVITNDDVPTKAVKTKKNSSTVVAFELLKEGRADALVSSGATGAVLTAAVLVLGRIKGISRPALCPRIPNLKGTGTLLCDCGANLDCKPVNLAHFAIMATAYAQAAYGMKNPKVGLLSNGTEDHKGSELQHETFPLLKAADAAGRIRFIGNVEASQVFSGDVDVVVTDGFTGNVLLKGIEGSIKYMTRQLKGIFMKNFKTKMAALAIKNEFHALKASLDPNEVGGTAMLGISKPVIKAHGSSDARAIYNAIRQAIAFVDSGIIDDITANISYMRVDKHAAKESD